MEIILEIDGKEYCFVSNRKAFSIIAGLNKDGDFGEDALDKICYALLKTKHNLTMEEVSELLDKAEEEYGVKQLTEFAQKMVEEVFSTEQDKNYKKIPYLAQHNKKNK